MVVANKKPKVVGMIPARMESSRLQGKALINIEGLPMVIHTCKRAQMAKSLNAVYLVTDSEEIRKAGEQFDIAVIMTSKQHKTGSDRIAEACRKIECDIVVNVQGDEPLVDPLHIDAIVSPLITDKNIKIAIGVTPYKEKNRPSDIKAVLDLEDNILYCSRTDLPSDERTPVKNRLKMCFIVPFRKDFLLQYSTWKPTPLEMIEYNEYLRVLEHGFKLRAVMINGAKISVDTAEDLKIVRALMVKDKTKVFYAKK